MDASEAMQPSESSRRLPTQLSQPCIVHDCEHDCDKGRLLACMCDASGWSQMHDGG